MKLADWLGVLSKIDALEIALGGAAITSLTAWSFIGLLKRWLEHFNFQAFTAQRPDDGGEHKK